MKIDNPFEEGLEKEHNFSTFRGVFRPTFLTIIGVMIFLRQGWVVGNAGILGAILVILMAFAITGFTVLSVSSIATNVKIRSGGVFSLVSQSLGLEIGGAIGIPLYLAQGLSGALYIRGFAEGWLLFFPNHNINFILVGVWLTVLIICFISTNFIFRIQAMTFFLVIIAVVALVINPTKTMSLDNIVLWGEFKDGNIWHLFAVFFPAATGVMVGVSMSGELKNSRYSIPIGTFCAWAVALMIYIIAAMSYAIKAPSEILITDNTIGISGGIFAMIASLGLLVSCFSATLSSFASAPQVLQALGDYGILSKRFGFHKKNIRGESRRCLFFTASLVLITLFLADLDDIAQVLTIFFILTYFIINVVLLIEKKVNMISFRPELSLSIIFPLLGSICCLVAILVISPIFGLLALFFMLFIYLYLTTKKLHAPWETVNSGLLLGIVNWGTKRLSRFSQSSVRAWRPDILMPTYEMQEIEESLGIVKGLIQNRGSILFLALNETDSDDDKFNDLDKYCKQLQKEELFVSYSKAQLSSFYYGLRNCLSFNKSDILGANIVFSNVKYHSEEEIKTIFSAAKDYNMSSLFYCSYPVNVCNNVNVVNIWIRDQSPDWRLSLQSTNLDCQILLSYLLKESWGVKVRLITVVKDKECKELARQYLELLVRFARISKTAEIIVEVDDFKNYLSRVSYARFNLFGLGDSINKSFMEELSKELSSPCLFVKESGNENALA